mgnify:CR=1 FL=1
MAQRIAIVRLSALGDVVNTLPALTALRRARPEAHIAWVCETASAGVLEGHPLLSELIVVPRKGWGASLKGLRGVPRVVGEVRRFARELRARGFDAAIDLQGNLRSGVITWLTRAPLRIGPARGKELGHIFLNHRVKLPAGPLHRVERALAILAALGIETADARPIVPVTDADRARVDAFLAASGLAACVAPASHGHASAAGTAAAGGEFAVIHAGTSPFGRYKQWPPERWAEVARGLGAELGLRVVLTRGPSQAEAESAEAMARAAGPSAIVAPLLSLRELGELFRRCRVFLSVDTGPMHLASAVGAPVVALFGPKDPRVYAPYFGPRAVVEKPLECRPCRRRSCSDPRCMLAITPAEVLAAAQGLLQ